MNLIQEGAHAAADWLLERIREAGCEVSLFIGTHGGLVTIYATTAKRRAGYSHAGDYGPGLRYVDAVEDMTFLAGQLQQVRAEA